MKIIDLSTGGSPRASGDGDSTGAAKGATGRESAPLGRIDRLAPRRAVAVQGIDGQRAAGSARESNDEAGSRTSFITLVAGSVASVIVSAHAPDEAPREFAAGDPAEYDCPVRILGKCGKGGARERAGEGKGAKFLHDILPSCRRWAGGRSTSSAGLGLASISGGGRSRGRVLARPCVRVSPFLPVQRRRLHRSHSRPVPPPTPPVAPRVSVLVPRLRL